MSSFSGIGSLSNALRAFQRELDVTGQNIANVETPGYSRQSVSLSSNFTTGFPFSTGNGVTVASVNRSRDTFLESRTNEVASDLERANTQSSGLSKVEDVLMEPSTTGISDAMSKFFDSWSALASNPTQTSLKSQVLQAGQTLADRVKGAYSSLDTLKQESAATVTESIDRVNELGKTIADLNNQIQRSVTTPNELLDKRDAAIAELATFADVKTSTLSDGSVTVSLNQLTLVSGSESATLPSSPVDTVAGTVGSGDQKVLIRSGSIRGQFDVQNSITSYQSQLDTVADALRSSVNAIHSTGPDGTNFFNTGTGAASLDIDAAIKGQPAKVATGTTSASGDGSLALQLSKLSTQGLTALGGKTLSDRYSDLVSTVGLDVKSAEESVSVQSALKTQLDSQVQSISGVSLDDEMANMLRFQRSYQAAAKALGTFDSMFDDLLGMMR